MGKVLFGILAAVASFMLVDSLTCNQCSYSVLGFCLSNSEVTCAETETCFTGEATFTSLPSVGFNTQGCLARSSCTTMEKGTVIGMPYITTLSCCNSDKCNTVTLSAAPSTKMSLTAALGVAVLASVWGSVL